MWVKKNWRIIFRFPMMQMSLLALQSVTKIAGIGPLKVILCFVF